MTLFIWRILSLVSAALFVGGVIFLLCARLLKNKFYHEFHEDELLKTVKTSNSKNSIYLTTGETAKFIKKYVVCKTTYDKYLVCNFAKKFEEISFFVVQFNRRKRAFNVLKITQRSTDDASKVITLSNKCRYVNIIISRADGIDINLNAIRPLAMSRVRIHAAVKGFMLFLSLFVVRHTIIELFGGIYTLQYLENFFNYVAIGAAFLLSVIYYFIDVLCFRRKNLRQLNGGALEYEFV
ncbi:MAG: hypothetical protein J1F61_03995 [Clostridiales bacterium]|nr:hypothetical protein [Clostridiales bacterium]